MLKNLIFRPPKKEDGLNVHRLIKSCPPLDLNSIYYYYIMCDDFSRTSLVAEADSRVVGYVSGYIPFAEDSLFVWQVAIDKDLRGRGLAGEMISELVLNCKEFGISSIKTTISPSNRASRKLFEKYATANGWDLCREDYLKPEDFGPGEHEAEELYTIKLK